MLLEPIWPRPAALPPADLPRRVDVAVVGAGITGLALLHHLSQAGMRCVVLERDRVAAGASGRNAGMLLTGLAESYAAAVRRHGRGTAAQAWTLTAANQDLLLDALGPEDAALASHRRAGAWTLAGDAAEADELRESAALLAEDRLPGVFHDRPERFAGPVAGLGGLRVEADGEIDPATACGALARRLIAEHPGAIVEGVTVSAIEASGHRPRVHTSRGEIEAGAVVVATNAHITGLVASVPVRPVRAQMLATAPRPLPHARAPAPAYAHRGHRYWRRLATGHLILGGCRDLAEAEEMTDAAEPTTTVQGHLDGYLRADLADDGAVERRWAGTMGFSPDGLPLVGDVPGEPGILVCGAYNGHGMGFAVAAARLVARRLRDGDAPPPWLDVARLTRSGGAAPSSPCRS